MKSISVERWREYFPFLEYRLDLAESYENRRQRFIQLVPDHYKFEALLHHDFESLRKAASGGCNFCQVVEQRLKACYRGKTSEYTEPDYNPGDRLDIDLEDLRNSSPRIWLEISLEPFDMAKTTLQEALTDAFIHIKHINTIIYPRFLISDVHPTTTAPQSDEPPWKRLNLLKTALLRPDSDTRNKTNFKLASQWLNTCKSKHKHCLLQDHKDKSLPTRLLDLSSPDKIVLCLGSTVEHEATKKTNLNYVTLSHRWGEIQPLQTTSDNYEKHLNGIPFSALPMSFQEAILFTRAMDVRYLWIDWLCIVQDSESDKGEEIPRMAKTYSSAFFNIAACSAGDCTYGLFAPRDAKMIEQQRISFTMRLADGHTEAVEATCSPVLRNFAHAGDEIENVLDDRGWIFQERALSKRIFDFEKKLLWFECREMFASENLPSGAPSNSSKSGLETKWENILPEIRNRQLTKIGDHLSHALMEDKTSKPFHFLAPVDIVSLAPPALALCRQHSTVKERISMTDASGPHPHGIFARNLNF